MVHYGQLLSELSAMDASLQASVANLRKVRSQSANQSGSTTAQPQAAPASAKMAPTSSSEALINPCRSVAGVPDSKGNKVSLLVPLHVPVAAAVVSVPSVASRPPQKPSSTVNSPSSEAFLHRACQLFPKNKEVIEIALSTSERTAVRQSVQILAATAQSNKKIQLRERYTYPINIAVYHKADASVLELLANAAPEILTMPDGRDGHTTLGLILQYRSRCNNNKISDNNQASSCLPLVDILLQANPDCAQNMVDRRQNTPLHVACSRGAPLEVIERLHRAYPAAMRQRNLAGETPLMVAQRFCGCREDVLDYLQKQIWGNLN